MMKSLLKVPKYKVCKVKMQRQLDEIKDVFTMSMDLSIDSDGDGGESLDFSDHEDDGEQGDDGSAEIDQEDEKEELELIDHPMPLPQEQLGDIRKTSTMSMDLSIGDESNGDDGESLCCYHDREDAGGSVDIEQEEKKESDKLIEVEETKDFGGDDGVSCDSENEEKEESNKQEEKMPLPPLPRRNEQDKFQEEGNEKGVENEEKEELIEVEAKKQELQMMPAPRTIKKEDKSPVDVSKKEVISSKHSHRSSSCSSIERNSHKNGHSQQSKRRSSSCQIGNRGSGNIYSIQEIPRGQQDRQPLQRQSSRQREISRPISSSFNSHPPHHYRNHPPPPPPRRISSIEPSTRLQPKKYEDEVSTFLPFMGNYDDDVSKLSIMENSVQSSPTVTRFSNAANGNSNNERQSSRNQDEERQDDAQALHNNMISTNDYDSKGRCIHHQHIRLRKKNLLGRGWKVLMSACPDCCANELHRMQLVLVEKKKEEVNQKLARDERSKDHGSRPRSPGRRSLSKDYSQSSKRSPSQDSFRDASVTPVNNAPRSLSQDSFQDNSITRIMNKARRLSYETASLTEGSGGSSDQSDESHMGSSQGSKNIMQLTARSPSLERVNMPLHRIRAHDDNHPKKKKKSRSKPKDQQQDQQSQPQQLQAQQGTMYAIQMQYTNEKGQSGIYNGQVNDNFVPHGNGIMVHDHNGSKKEGEWKNGRYRHSNSKSNGSKSSKSSKGSGSGSRSRSRSNSGESERSKSRSHSTRHRQHSFSRSRQQQPLLPQVQIAV